MWVMKSISAVNDSGARASIVLSQLQIVGQPIQAADPLSSGSSRLKAGCWSF
jgi:hypothetical protein